MTAVTFHEYAIGDRIVLDDALWEVRRIARTRWGSPTVRGESLDGTLHRWITPRKEGRKASLIDRASIRAMVESFYAHVAEDDALGPIFEARVHGDREPHLAKMVSFWSSVLLREGSFVGHPPLVHHAIAELSPAHFERWLAILDRTLDEVFTEQPAHHVKVRARILASGLSTAVFGAPWDAPRASG